MSLPVNTSSEEYNVDDIDLDNLSDHFNSLNFDYADEPNDGGSTNTNYNSLSPYLPNPPPGFRSRNQSLSHYVNQHIPTPVSSPWSNYPPPAPQNSPSNRSYFPFPSSGYSIWTNTTPTTGFSSGETITAEVAPINSSPPPIIYTERRLAEMMMQRSGKTDVLNLFQNHDRLEILDITNMITANTRTLKNICTNLHGSKSMMVLVANLKEESQVSLLLSGIACIAPTIAMSLHGWRVIKDCLDLFSFQQNRDVMLKMAERCMELATNQFGSSLIWECVVLARGNMREQLLLPLIVNAVTLADDPHGNFIIQNLLIGTERSPSYMHHVLPRFRGNIVSLSMSKYGSHVVEKCLKNGGEASVIAIISEIMTSARLVQLIEDPYGNFVVQTALKESRGKVHVALIEMIEMNEKKIDNNRFGKMVLKCLRSNNNHN